MARNLKDEAATSTLGHVREMLQGVSNMWRAGHAQGGAFWPEAKHTPDGVPGKSCPQPAQPHRASSAAPDLFTDDLLN